MIVEHDEMGRVTHLIFDPVHPDVLKHYGGKRGALIIPDLWLEDRPSAMTHYVVGHELVERPVLAVDGPDGALRADSEDAFVIAGLPVPCLAVIDGNPVDIADGELTLTSAMPATYSVVFDQWPYQTKAFEVTFDAA